MDFVNKVVIITGASAGIGASSALLFAEQSSKLVLVGRNNNALNKVGKKCEEMKGIQPLIVIADLTSDEDVKNVVTKTIDTFGKIDVLVNNAGVGVFANIIDGVEFYDKAMNTNIRPAYILTSLAVPYLIESKGNVINISSILGLKPIKHLNALPYGMSKAAMDLFTKHLALELANKGVRVNSVNPGATKTGFMIASGCSETKLKQLNELHVEKLLPLGKMTESNEVADLILYLASDKAKSITGGIFVIDNGGLLV